MSASSAQDERAPLASEAAILRTVLYADVFDYPLTLSEIHRYLVGERLPLERVQEALDTSPWLAERVARVNGYYTAAGREVVAGRRGERGAGAARLWRSARWYGRLVAHLPFVRMVAVTGALAMDNVTPDDDIDLLIITQPGRVWLARAFVIVVVRWARLFGVSLCPNYLLADTALRQDRRDLFMAHELAQMVPLAGLALYWRMRRANGWAAELLPNADLPPRVERDRAPRGAGLLAQRALEQLLRGGVGDWLERWERERKLVKFGDQLRQPGSAAVLDAQRVKGHFHDYGGVTLREYQRRCAEYFVNGWKGFNG